MFQPLFRLQLVGLGFCRLPLLAGLARSVLLGFRFRCCRLRLRRPRKGIGSCSASAPAFPLGAMAAGSLAIFILTATTAALGSLGPMLGHQLIELAVLEHLADGAHREAENGNGGPEVQGLLDRPG